MKTYYKSDRYSSPDYENKTQNRMVIPEPRSGNAKHSLRQLKNNYTRDNLTIMDMSHSSLTTYNLKLIT